MRQRHRCVCPGSPVEKTRVCHNHRLGLFLALLLHTCPFCPVPRLLKASPCHSSPMSLFNQTPMLVPPKASCCPLALSSSQRLPLLRRLCDNWGWWGFVHRQGAGTSGAARRWPGTGSQGPPWSRGSRGTTHQQATSSSAGSQRVGLAGSPGVTPVAHSDPKLRARGTDEQQCHAKSVLFSFTCTQYIEAKSNISS